MAVTRLGAAARVPVLPLVAPGWSDAGRDLALDPRLRLVATPRAATVLLLAGPVAEAHADAAARVHDQLPEPRATVCWGTPPPARFAGVVAPEAVVRGDADVARTLVETHHALLRGERRSEPTLLPDEPPNPWRGAGSHGQGGEGMMGGTPYGRPMAMTADDRDGLALDALSLRVGPWLPGFPPGLVLDVTLQGDVVQAARVVTDGGAAAGGHPSRDDVLVTVRREAVAIADLEAARARAHLRWCADLLALHGLDALGRRVLRLAAEPRPPARAVGRLASRLRHVLDAATTGVGVVSGDLAAAVGGPVARAAGHADDLRADLRAYRDLGFAVVTSDGGDARARWRQRLAEAAQSADLAARAETRGGRTGPHDAAAAAWASSGAAGPSRLLDALPDLLAGTEWGEAVTTIASLDLTPDAAVRGAEEVPA